jgi:putative ABC transport system permease protein
MRRRVPLAWRILCHDPRRLALSVGGITFAVLIIFAEVGFLNGLYDGQVEVLDKIDGDAFILSRVKFSLAVDMPFPRRRIEQALACDSVASAAPLWIAGGALWRNPADHSLHRMRVLGIDPGASPSADPEVTARLEELTRPDTVLVDRRSRSYLGPRDPGVVTEVSRRRFRGVGTFDLGTDLVFNGTLVTSDRSFLEIASDADASPPRLERVELGVLKLRPGRDPARALEEVRAILPRDVVVLSREELVERELTFWKVNTPIGAMFGLGALMGFVVGIFICFQVLATEVTDQVRQLATLRAIGHEDKRLLRLVLQQAVILALFGFAAGLLLSELLYGWLDGVTGIHMRLTVGRAAVVFGLALVMCAVSGCLAARKALAADPAELF